MDRNFIDHVQEDRSSLLLRCPPQPHITAARRVNSIQHSIDDCLDVLVLRAAILALERRLSALWIRWVSGRTSHHVIVGVIVWLSLPIGIYSPKSLSDFILMPHIPKREMCLSCLLQWYFCVVIDSSIARLNFDCSCIGRKIFPVLVVKISLAILA
jgi:hypothetical protein